MRRHHLRWTVLGLMLAAAASGCGITVAAKPPAKPVKAVHQAVLQVGPTRLAVGSVWQLNDPGGGSPRESLTITRLAGSSVRAQIYIAGSGSLFDINVSGHFTRHDTALRFTGTLSQPSLSGNNVRDRLTILAVPKGARVMWVTQRVNGAALDTFSQLSFHEISG
jgi:hypothetical protein